MTFSVSRSSRPARSSFDPHRPSPSPPPTPSPAPCGPPPPTAPLAVLDAVIRVMRPTATETGLVLTRHCEPGVPETILADGARLRQVLFNLVGNAIKFTPRGEVSVTLSAHMMPDGRREL